jgi:ribosomal protein S12 methylthiotransferase accessory factor YcaO
VGGLIRHLSSGFAAFRAENDTPETSLVYSRLRNKLITLWSNFSVTVPIIGARAVEHFYLQEDRNRIEVIAPVYPGVERRKIISLLAPPAAASRRCSGF